MGVLIAYQIGLLGRRRVGAILEEMQPTPAVFQLVIQLIRHGLLLGGKSGLNLFLQQRSTAATPQLENLSVWERLRKDTQGLMTHRNDVRFQIMKTYFFLVLVCGKKIHEMSVVF